MNQAASEAEKLFVDQYLMPGLVLLFMLTTVGMFWCWYSLQGEYLRVKRERDLLSLGRVQDRERSLLRWVKQAKPSGVYFISSGEAIKIGISTDVVGRMRSLQTASPYPLRLMAFLPGATPRDEAMLHRKFAHLRLEGEWFKPGPDLLEYVFGLKKVEY